MLFRTVHTTKYRYDQPVSQSISEARMTPRLFSGQKVFETRLTIDPGFATLSTRVDYFGNVATTIAVFGMHDRFTVTATSLVETGLAPARDVPPVPWEAVRDELAAPLAEESLAASEYIFESPYVALGQAVQDYAAATFAPGRPLHEAVEDLMHRIHADFRYMPDSTEIGVSTADLLKDRRGVCQDFSHVMIGAMRSVGLAARYVSGYLRSGQGAEASHAWVSVFFPGVGWLDFDPTNNLMPTDGHVTVGWGRDFGDVTPLKGVALGGGGQKVDVEVRVTPA